MAEVTRCFTSAKNRYGLRVERLLPSACPYALPRHRSYVTVSGAAVCSYGHKLSLTAALCYAVNPKPPLAFPSCRRRSASLPSSFHPCAILTATFSIPLRLCRQPHKLPARQLSLSVCDAMPAPGPSVWCADAQTPLRLSANHFTHSELAYGLGQGQAG